MPAARFQPKSSNKKLAPIEKVPYTTGNPIFHGKDSPFRFRPTPRAPFCSSTYASIAATCSEACPFKKDENGEPGGCFVDADFFTRRAMERLDAGAADMRGREVTAEEAALIDGAFVKGMPQDGARGGRDLRIHVGGDVPDEWSARMLAGAAARWLGRGGGRPWSYTHSWARVPAAAFWPISILASIERPDQVKQARARGYAPALVVERFPNGKKPFEVAGTTFIPCPAEASEGKTCVQGCRLCLEAPLFEKNQGIAFQVHGADASAAKSALVPLRVGRAA